MQLTTSKSFSDGSPRTRVLASGVVLGVLIGPSAWGITAATVVLPTAAEALDATPAAMAWPITTYIAAMAVASAVGGRLIGVRGAVLVLKIGAVLLVLGGLGATLAADLGWFTVSRLVLGAGAGLLAAASFGIAGAVDSRRRPEVLAVIAAVMAGSVGTGPLLGGLLEGLSWRVSMLLPLAALVAVPLLRRTAAQVAGRADARIDVPGAVLLILAVGGLVLLIQAPATDLDPVGLGLAGAVAVAGGIGLARRVRVVPDGFLPRAVVGERSLAAWWVAGLGGQAGQVAGLVLVPTLLVESASWTPAEVGLVLAVLSVAGVLSSTVAGRGAATRRGPLIAAAGGIALAAGLVATAAWRPEPWLVLCVAALSFAAFSAVQVVALHRVSDQVSPELVPAATGILSLVFLVGGALGSAVASTSASLVGFGAAGWSAAVLPLLGALAAAGAATRQSRR